MLEKRTYTLAELAQYLGATGKTAIERKLARYGITYTTNGGGRDPTYTITENPDPFRVFCVFDLGFDPHTDFTKLRDFLFYLLGDPDFGWRPMEMMEEYLRIEGHGISRQTISRYIARLEGLGLLHMGGELVYYKVYKRYGVQEHELITKEQYCKAWAVYWDRRENGYDSRAAYSSMYSSLGGVPRKQHTIEQNAVCGPTLDLLERLVSDSFLAEYGGA